ncbi:two-component regulator propeller domain-containing protein [Fulvivirgaceae bacterium BMA12]|uniref:histidine kinase n=1 Tax=Agaribacillus aureus TaxID=3051825 RepID=A0ABT8L9N8_9BACT|nr:two-component regulator propeller domain-containing protein [Fulvivirgaceae bacterium BMA12]
MNLQNGTISKFLLVAVTLLSIYSVAAAQDQQIAFRHLSTVDGLSNFTVLSITQDRQGFMWFGTMDGLNRFDGKQIRTYRFDKDDPYSLGNNLVHALLCTSDSGLWVGTGQGLYYYDYHHDSFHTVPVPDVEGAGIEDLEIKSIIQDQQHIWLGTSQGLFRYNLKSEQFDPYLKQGAKNIITETVEAIHKADDGGIWIGGKQGLLLYKNGNLVEIEIDRDLKYQDKTNVISINSDETGRIWFGTLDQDAGLIIYDPVKEKFTDLNTRDGFIPHNKVNCLYKFDAGKIWVGTTWGLSVIDQNNFSSQHLFYERQNPGSISHNSIRDIYQGEDGIIWIGTYSGGVNYFDTRSQLIRHHTNIYQNKYSLSFNIVSSIFEDSHKDLWIGTEYGGLNVLSRSDKTYSVLRRSKDPNSLKSDNVKSTIEDNKGRKFIATQFGLSIYDPTSRSFFNVDDTPGPRGRLNFYGVLDLCKDNAGNIWIGTHRWIGISKIPGPGYLLMYDTNSDSIIHYYPENKKLAIIEGGVNTLVYDPDKDIIWSGGDNGLTGFDNKTKRYLTDDTFYQAAKTIEGTVINDLFLDENDLLWIATFGQGLFIMDVNSFQLRKISAREGLAESSFYSITGDNDGNIWTSVSAYLLKIDASTNIHDRVNHVERYGIQEGFPPQQFFRSAACKGSDGTLYFGGDDGYIAFKPEEVENIVFHPSVAILDILVNGKSLELTSDKENQHLNVASLKSLPLTYDQSSFAVQFIAPNFINPDNTWYQYQLSGIHESWQDLGNSNTINFTELKAGDYELKIRASSDPESFSEDYTSILLNVAPPYWGTPLAYFIYFVLILSLLYIFFVISRKWERLNQNLKFEHLQREQEKEFNQKRVKFFTDISHELRTPLTLILAPLERIIKSNFGNLKVKNQLMLMLRNGERMLQLINQLLDLRKLETGHMQLQVAKGNMAQFIKEISLSFRELAHDRNIEFEVISNQETVNVWFDRDKFEIILFNLLSNAIKYTPEYGKISVQIGTGDSNTDTESTTQKTAKSAFIRIDNTGYGIPEDQIGHIFERFYSGKEDLADGHSSGVGLEIVKNMVDLHKGEIFVESKYDKNGINGITSFKISLKSGKKHFTKNEILKDYKSSEDISNYKNPAANTSPAVATIGSADNLSVVDDPGKESILIVEDNNEVRALVVNLFRDQYNTIEAANGWDGLKLAREKIPDLVISDIMMPAMDGIEFCRKVKSDIATSHIPVILLTARTAVTFKYEGLETGADDYIVKPFNVDDLRLRSQNLIRQRKLLKERFSQTGSIIPAEISLTSVDEKLIQKTLDYISENIGESDLTVDKIAREIGMSRTNFYRKIKALTNLSPAEFLRKIRMDHAAQLLRTNKIRVSEVRFMVGISDADYFRDCFKKQFGVTPKVYIENQKN